MSTTCIGGFIIAADYGGVLERLIEPVRLLHKHLGPVVTNNCYMLSF